jgi:hypothetical protein
MTLMWSSPGLDDSMRSADAEVPMWETRGNQLRDSNKDCQQKPAHQGFTLTLSDRDTHCRLQADIVIGLCFDAPVLALQSIEEVR